jgi:hypothetical protein
MDNSAASQPDGDEKSEFFGAAWYFFQGEDWDISQG